MPSWKSRDNKGNSSTGKQDDGLILRFQWYVAGQVSIVILLKQAGQNRPKQVGQKGNCCFLGRPRSRLVRKRQSHWVRWALSQGQFAVWASSAHRRRSSVWELSDTRLRPSLFPPLQVPLQQVRARWQLCKRGSLSRDLTLPSGQPCTWGE